MSRRPELYDILKRYVDNVYFQPPEDLKINYPCIIFSREPDYRRAANNKGYVAHNLWDLVYIDQYPDSGVPDRLINDLPMCEATNYYVADNLNHVKLRLYF